MQTRIKSWDLRPFSEYFYEQAAGRKHFRFLYYCRNCIKNFDTPGRVAKCKFCGKDSIVELPKNVWKRKDIFRKPIIMRSVKAFAARLSKKADPKEKGFDFATKLRIAMLYYFNMPPEHTDSDMGAEDISQGNLLRNFQLV